MCNNFCWMKKNKKGGFYRSYFLDTSVAVRMKKWAAQVPTAWCLKLCKCLLVCSLPYLIILSRKFYPFQTGKFYHLVSNFETHLGFLGCEKKKDIVKIQGSVTSHPNYAAKILVSESVYWKFPQAKGGEVLCRNLHTQRKIQGAISWTSS